MSDNAISYDVQSNELHIAMQLSESQIRNLAAILTAQNVLEALKMDIYQSSSYIFRQQGENLTIEAKDNRGIIAQLHRDTITGQVSKQDVLHFSELTQAVEDNLRSSNLLHLADSILQIVPSSQKNLHSATISVSNVEPRGIEF